MSDRDLEAFEHYDDPVNREPAPGVPRRRRERSLTQHVPVRFSASTVDAVRGLAEDDGMSVSSWIRHTVEREVARRSAPELTTKTEPDVRAAVERLRQDVAELAATLEGSESR